MRPALALFVALAAFALLLTACGGEEPDLPPSGDSTAAGSAPAAALEQVVRDARIQVGIIRSLPDNTYPQYIDMMRANADQLAQRLR